MGSCWTGVLYPLEESAPFFSRSQSFLSSMNVPNFPLKTVESLALFGHGALEKTISMDDSIVKIGLSSHDSHPNSRVA